ncbi:STE3-domain-containing protein [Phanerochaete sordida]|uniref:STE3-domain-containing protein n=1 Tax=Phanerochaete sordida TaxID=48140 RepID=A0A9P3G6H7_9APHY|nr:STE3-domain-containing protein [Phanerochaete sordida]
MSDPTYPLFPVVSFLGAVAAFIPLPWHLQAWNAGTCMYMLWAGLASFVQFVNALVWHGSLENRIPVWCDITTKFVIGAGVGIPAASLCINRRLYGIAAVRQTALDRHEKRREVYIDLAIGLGIPVLVMCLHTVVQGHRFNIVEDIGCVPAIYVTPLTFPLVFMWPVLLGVVSFIYAFMTLRAFWIRRVQFRALLASSPSLSLSRYFRLMLLSSLEMCLTVPLAAYSIYVNTHGVPVAPWISWADTHYDFWRVLQIPAVFWRADAQAVAAYEMGRWVYPCAAFLFFGLFGFAEEARRHYRAAFWCIVRPFGWTPEAPKVSLGSYSLPSSPSPRTPTPARDFLPSYARSTHDVVLQSSLTAAHKAAARDVEKGLETPTYLDATRSQTALGCIVAAHDPFHDCTHNYTHDATQGGVHGCIHDFVSGAHEPDVPSTPTTACSACFGSDVETDVGSAH